MKTKLMPVAALTLGLCLPLYAQTGAGTPPVTQSAPANRPIPQKIILGLPSDQTGALRTNRDAYAPGQPVAITFVVSNPTSKAVPYNFPTGQQFDATVLDVKGNMVWQWSRGKMFTQSLSHVSLAPGQKLSYNAAWNGRDAQGKPVASGVYTVNARLTNSTGQAITGSVLVNTDTDPNNMGVPTKTPADTGAIRAVDASPQVSASKQIAIGVPASQLLDKK